MSNPLTLVDIQNNQVAMSDLEKHYDQLFNYENHRRLALQNAKQIHNSQLSDDAGNVFGIYHENTFIGLTGLWYENHPVLVDLALLRWTSLCLPYRGLRLSPYVVSLLSDMAKANKRSMLVEIAHTENAKNTFQHLDFKLVENNERYIKALITVLGEDNGSFILTKTLVPGFTYDWEGIYDLARTIAK